MITAHNNLLCASWADEYRPATFGILINFSNLAVVKKVTANQPAGWQGEQQEHRIPNLRKALNVVRHVNRH